MPRVQGDCLPLCRSHYTRQVPPMVPSGKPWSVTTGMPQDPSVHNLKHPDQQRALLSLQGKQVFCEGLCGRLRVAS